MTTDLKAPTILIIYQGPNAKLHRDDVTVYLASKVSPKPFVRHLDDGDNSFQPSIYRKYLEFVAECDAAIALITPDPRKASNAGNVWLEIGIWLALKSERSLLVLRHKKVKEFPSDIVGGILPKFGKIVDIESDIQRFVDGVAERIRCCGERNAGGFGKADKVRDIFWRSAKDSEEAKTLFNCLQSDEKCLRKEELFCFGSELIQMRNIFWELHVIQHSLFRIAYFVDMIESTYHAKEKANTPGMRKNRKDYVKEIHEILLGLEELSSKYMASIRSKYPKVAHSMDRLDYFLEHRLKDAEKIGQRDLLKKGVVTTFETLKTGVKEFSKWAQDVLKNEMDLGLYVESASKASLLVNHKEFCINMATILTILVERDYEACFDILGAEFGKVENPVMAHEAISSMNRKFPHNDTRKQAVRIWPKE